MNHANGHYSLIESGRVSREQRGGGDKVQDILEFAKDDYPARSL